MRKILGLLICIIIVFLISRSCEDNQKKALESINETNKMIRKYQIGYADFKRQYDFNLDSLSKIINTNETESFEKNDLKFPIIIYSNKEDDDSIVLAGINRNLDRKLISFSLDSIKTIVMLENSRVTVGTYTNNSTVGQKYKMKISFIEKQTMKQISSITLDGGDPPRNIKYKENSPILTPRIGSMVSEDDIIKAIKTKISQ